MSLTFRRYIETNDNEGETWSFWLQTDGNELPMARLSAWLQEREAEEQWFPYELTEDLLPEPDIDVLVDNAEDGYFLSHNKVVGKLELPGDLGDDFAEKLYKGGIEDFFHREAEETARLARLERQLEHDLSKYPYALRTAEVAEITGISASRWHKQRMRGQGLPFVRPNGGRAVRYLKSDVIRFLIENRVDPEDAH